MNNYGKWEVSSNFVCGERLYIAARLIDKDGIDHSGNREYAGGYSTDSEAVQKLVDELNEGTCFIKENRYDSFKNSSVST